MDNTEIEYFKAIITPLLSYPDSLKVEKALDERGILLTVNVHPSDMGRVIGFQGKNMGSMRVLTSLYGKLRNKSISVVLQEPAHEEEN